MEYTLVNDLKWADELHTAIDCKVIFPQLSSEFIPFTAASYDSVEYGIEIFNRAVSGEFGDIAEYVKESLNTDNQ